MLRQLDPVPNQKFAVRIQRFWRSRFPDMSSAKLAELFRTAKLGETDARSFTFEQVVVHLRVSSTIEVTTGFLKRLMLATRDRGPHNSRVFVAAVMCAYFERHTFEEMGDVERALTDAARKLLKCVDAISIFLTVSRFFCHVPAEYLQEFPVLIKDYEQKFRAWKLPDAAKLVGRINHALRSLVWAFVELDPLDPLNEDVRKEFRMQIRRLSVKLVQIQGPGALQEFETLRATVMPWETLDELNPVDWALWTNHFMDGAFHFDWEAFAAQYMTALLA